MFAATKHFTTIFLTTNGPTGPWTNITSTTVPSTTFHLCANSTSDYQYFKQKIWPEVSVVLLLLKVVRWNKYSCSGAPAFKSGSCRVRFS